MSCVAFMRVPLLSMHARYGYTNWCHALQDLLFFITTNTAPKGLDYNL